MKSKWQILKNSIVSDLPPIQENITSFADVVKAATMKLKEELRTDHLDTTLEIHIGEDEDPNPANSGSSGESHANSPKSALKKSHSISDFKEMTESTGKGREPNQKTLRKSMSFTDFQILAEVSKKVSYEEMWTSGKDMCLFVLRCLLTPLPLCSRPTSCNR